MEVSRMTKGSWGKIRAFFDLTTKEGFTIKGFKLVEGIDGLFVGFPSQKSGDEYKDTVYADQALKQKVNALSLEKYEEDDTQPSTAPPRPLADIKINEGFPE